MKYFFNLIVFYFIKCFSRIDYFLINSVLKNDITSVKMALKSGANPNAINNKKSNWNALSIAVFRNYKEIAKLLIDFGALNITNKDNSSPLLWAYNNNNIDLMNYIINRGAYIDSYYQRILYYIWLLITENIKGVEWLIQDGFDINRNIYYKVSCYNYGTLENSPDYQPNLELLVNKRPIYFAIKYKNPLIVNLLIQKGANIETDDLYYSCTINNTSIFSSLFSISNYQKALDIKIKNELLNLSCSWENYETAKYLIEHGADPNLDDRYNKLILDMVVENKINYRFHHNKLNPIVDKAILIDNEYFVEFLLEKGAISKKYFRTCLLEKGAISPIHNIVLNSKLLIGVVGDYPRIVEDVIIKNKKNKNYISELNNAFQFAVQHAASINTINLLIDNGVENDILKDPNTLITSILNCSIEIPTLLIEKGAIVDLNKFEELLFSIIKFGHYQSKIKFLIDNGVDVNFNNDKGLTPLLHTVYCYCNIPKFNYDYNEFKAELEEHRTPNQISKEMEVKQCNHINVYKEIFEILVSNGADVNAINSKGNAPLMILLKIYYDDISNNDKHNEIINYLINNGADLDIINFNDMEIINAVKKTKNYYLIELIKNKGIIIH